MTSKLLTNGVITPYEPYEAFLLGIPDLSNIATVLQPDTHAYASHYGFFVQDDYKVNSRLTLNVGMRYEYHPILNDHLSNTTNFVPGYTSIVNGQTVHGAVIISNQGSYKILKSGLRQVHLPDADSHRRSTRYSREPALLAKDRFCGSHRIRLEALLEQSNGDSRRVRKVHRSLNRWHGE